jgi:hypothetical protein
MTDEDEHAQILNAVTEYILETHQFPSCTEISEYVKISKPTCLKLCKELVSDKQLCIVFEGEGRPSVYSPYDMMQVLLRTQKKPAWLSNYSFNDEPPLISKATEIEKNLQIYDIMKRLLYSTDMPLEESVAFSLQYLGFDNVVHQTDNKDNPDITLEYNNAFVLIEVEGKTRAGSKDKVLQLEGWVTREITSGKKNNEVQGVYVINHWRDTDPSLRSAPLTDHGKEFMNRYGFKLLTSPTLFLIMKDVIEGKLSKEDARKKVWEGDIIA